MVLMLTYAHDFAIWYQTGAEVRVFVLLHGHQHADDLSCDKGVVEALLRRRLPGELAVHRQRSLRVWWLQQLHKLNVGIMHLQQWVSGLVSTSYLGDIDLKGAYDAYHAS